jgi:hypothetical protein
VDYFGIGLLGAIALLWSVLGLRMLRGTAGIPRLADVIPRCFSPLMTERGYAWELATSLPESLTAR